MRGGVHSGDPEHAKKESRIHKNQWKSMKINENQWKYIEMQWKPIENKEFAMKMQR